MTETVVIQGRLVGVDGPAFIMCRNGKIYSSDYNANTAWTPEQ